MKGLAGFNFGQYPMVLEAGSLGRHVRSGPGSNFPGLIVYSEPFSDARAFRIFPVINGHASQGRRAFRTLKEKSNNDVSSPY